MKNNFEGLSNEEIERLVYGMTISEFGLPEITVLLTKKCTCETPVSFGSSQSLIGLSSNVNPRRCLNCQGTFDATTQPYETWQGTAQNAEKLKRVIDKAEATTRETCQCFRRNYDKSQAYHLSDIVRCQNPKCFRVQGRVDVVTV